MTVPQTTAFLERADLFIGADSGPVAPGGLRGDRRRSSSSAGRTARGQWRPWSRRSLVLRHRRPLPPLPSQGLPAGRSPLHDGSATPTASIAPPGAGGRACIARSRRMRRLINPRGPELWRGDITPAERRSRPSRPEEPDDKGPSPQRRPSTGAAGSSWPGSSGSACSTGRWSSSSAGASSGEWSRASGRGHRDGLVTHGRDFSIDEAVDLAALGVPGAIGEPVLGHLDVDRLIGREVRSGRPPSRRAGRWS